MDVGLEDHIQRLREKLQSTGRSFDAPRTQLFSNAERRTDRLISDLARARERLSRIESPHSGGARKELLRHPVISSPKLRSELCYSIPQSNFDTEEPTDLDFKVPMPFLGMRQHLPKQAQRWMQRSFALMGYLDPESVILPPSHDGTGVIVPSSVPDAPAALNPRGKKQRVTKTIEKSQFTDIFALESFPLEPNDARYIRINDDGEVKWVSLYKFLELATYPSSDIEIVEELPPPAVSKDPTLLAQWEPLDATVVRRVDIDTNEMARLLINTYFIFCQSSQLAHLLFLRVSSLKSGGVRRRICQKIAKFISTWLSDRPRDFVDDELRESLEPLLVEIEDADSRTVSFINTQILDAVEKYGSQEDEVPPDAHVVVDSDEEDRASSFAALSSVAETEQESDDELFYTADTPECLIPQDETFPFPFDILAVHELELARQFCLLEHSIYRAISSDELVYYVLKKKEADTLAPHMGPYIERFNYVSKWVATTILMEPDLKLRRQVMSQFVRTAMCLFEMRNFNGVFEIVGGLTMATVQRLRNTFSGLPGSTTAAFKKLRDLVSPVSGHKTYRKQLAIALESETPGIPYIGMWMTDLTFIHEGNPTMKHNLINLFKMKLIMETLGSYSWFQNYRYQYKSHCNLQAGLWSNLDVLEPARLERLSEAIEPKKSTLRRRKRRNRR